MKLGLKIINNAILLSISQNKVSEVDKILKPFYNDPENLDLLTISKLEVVFNTEMLIVPTKKQWRRIKLEKLNKICR